MPILITLRTRWPVYPRQSPLRTRLRRRTFVEHRVDFGYDVLAVEEDLLVLGARSATCSTERFSVILILSPLNMASMRSLRPDWPASSITVRGFRR